jgi:hypothetical protein
MYLSGHYDWLPVPADVTVTPHDVAAGRVKPAANGGYSMRAEITGDAVAADAHNESCISEQHIINEIIRAYTDKGKQKLILTRHEAVTVIMNDLIVPHHTHRRWMKHIDVHDDGGPDEALFRASIAPHLEADHGRAPGKNIDAEDVEEMVAAYLTPMTEDDHRDHLHAHFKLKPKAVS